MKVWLLTTGSSDIQLLDDALWRDWNRDLRDEWYRLSFEPKQLLSEVDEPYRVAPRILGMIYAAQPDEVWEYLTFPLLDAFKGLMREQEIDKVVLLLTDQEAVFGEESRNSIRCPFWQDTCGQQPMFERYFKREFPEVEFIPILLKPGSTEQGLDDWNHVLTLTRSVLHGVELDPNVVYVSHQAGTPAISSAVQFVSLTRFRNKVKFLVSNEYDTQKTQFIPSSNYFRGIQVQEAIALLNSFNYVGVRDILELSTLGVTAPDENHIKHLLNAAVQWNFAEFQRFKKAVQKHVLIQQTDFPWWRVSYESAYLGWVRLQQGNTVDAMFHSFRAVEGSAGLWAEQNYRDDVSRDGRRGLQLKQSVLQKVPAMQSWFSSGQYSKSTIGLYGKSLFALLKHSSVDWKSDKSIRVFYDCIDNHSHEKDIFEWRNNLYHRLEGLQPAELFDAWDATTEQDWIKTVLGCLNFISAQDFASLEEVSLMSQVHQKLENAIHTLL